MALGAFSVRMISLVGMGDLQGEKVVGLKNLGVRLQVHFTRDCMRTKHHGKRRGKELTADSGNGFSGLEAGLCEHCNYDRMIQ